MTLIEELRRHATDEDAALYRLAAARAPIPVGRNLLAALRTAWLAKPPAERTGVGDRVGA